LLPGVGFPDRHLFLGQRGPLAERGIREIIAKLGQAAKLSSPLGPHDLRHTFAKSLLDPSAYGLDRAPMPLPAIQQLLATLISRPRPSTHGFLLMTLRV
jgi:site-specific recombinase XerD